MRALVPLFACLTLALAPPFAWAAAGNVTPFAGGAVAPPSPATAVVLDDPRSLAIDASGTVIFFNSGSSVRKLSGGTIQLVVENAGRVDALVADAAGNLYYCDSQSHQVKRIDPAGAITIVAGIGTPGFAGDNGAAITAQLDTPKGIALLGNDLLVADSGNKRIRRISGGTITTVAGNGTSGDGGDGGPALQAQLGNLAGIVGDGAGGFFFVQNATGLGGGPINPGRVRHVDPSGNITTLAGVGTSPLPGSMARAASGDLYVAGGISVSNVVFRISPAGTVTLAAGTGAFGFVGDTFPATSANLASPMAVALSPSGEIYIADSFNNRIRKVDTAGIIRTVAGGGGNDTSIQAPGDGGPPEQAVLLSPDGVATRLGSVLIADPSDHHVREVIGTTIRSRVAGTLNEPRGVAYDDSGNAYIADTGDNRILRLPAGGGCCTTFVFVTGPTAIALRGSDAYVASPTSNRVYRIAGGVTTVFAGSGSAAHGGDGGPATSAGMTPGYITFDAAGNLYISDGVAHRVRKVDTAGNISTVAGNGTKASSGDGTAAIAASLDTPAGLAVADGILYIAEAGSNRIRAVRTDGVIETVAGTGAAGFGGDGGPASAALFDGLRGMAWDETTSSLLVADSGNHRVRRIEIIDTVPAAFSLGDALLGVAQSVPQQSPTITPAGYNRPAAISITGGEYSIGCTTTFTSAAGVLAPGQSVCVRHVSASFGGTDTTTILTIGGVAATFRSRTVPAGTIEVTPASIIFPPGGPNLPQTVTIRNTGAQPVRVNSIATTGPFSVTHDCALLAPAATCAAQVSYVPTAAGFQSGELRMDATSANANYVVELAAGTAATVAELIQNYYQSILRRASDAQGLAFWQAEAARMAAFGANGSEVFYAIAAYFFFSTEYAALARDDTGFVTDLYDTFFQRAPDAQGLAFWVGMLGQGMPREVVLSGFLFSPEFGQFMSQNAGAVPARAEIDMVMDFYRGLLARLPDQSGFAFWLGALRGAQCAGTSVGAAQVRFTADSISSAFITSSEYITRARGNAQYVGDLYNAFLRRGGDLAGVQFWIGKLDSNAMTREQVRQYFAVSTEFAGRIGNVIAQGCLP